MPPRPLNPIPFDRVEQSQDHYCGPATAVMILRAKGVFTQPTEQNEELQDDLWDVVMEVTTGPNRPPGSEDGDGYIDEFEGQQCVPCILTGFRCWSTTPQALRAALNEHLPKKKYSVTRQDDEIVLTGKVLKSIDKGHPGAVAVGTKSHWVVVRGYLAGSSDFPSIMVGSVALNGIYLHDPNPGAGEPGLDMLGVNAWFDKVAVVKCGSTQDANKYVAVVRTST